MSSRVLYLAHANGFPGASYQTFLDPLSRSFDVRYLDMIGHHPDWPVDLHWRSLVNQLEHELTGLPKPLVGVGHSMGALLMLLVAARRQEWFEAVVLLDPPLMNGWYARYFNLMRTFGFVDRISPAGRSKGRRELWDTREQAVAYFHSKPFFQALDPRCLEDYLNAVLEVSDQGGWRLRYRPSVEVDIFRTTPGNIDDCPRLRVPGLIINGRSSPVYLHRCVRRLVKQHGLRHAEVDGGHMFPLERPEAIASVIHQELAGMGVTGCVDGGPASTGFAGHG